MVLLLQVIPNQRCFVKITKQYSHVIRTRLLHRAIVYEKEFKLRSRPPTDRTRDFIGPPDTASNLRPIIFRSDNVPPVEKRYHEKYENVMKWNQDFWANHNKNFTKKKEEYIEQTLKSKSKVEGENPTLTPGEMSVFYKQFLDENYRLHTQYNIEWYKKNISLLFPALQVAINRFVTKLKG
ncbi:hypothetical protein SNE40_009205 [Patella caerulea]|uniref:Apoptogenic protein 1, mitochondrial n=1 Tax=Patella caerulea TaxID=87958 RepID=A0AAN8JRK3_PATCE